MSEDYKVLVTTKYSSSNGVSVSTTVLEFINMYKAIAAAKIINELDKINQRTNVSITQTALILFEVP